MTNERNERQEGRYGVAVTFHGKKAEEDPNQRKVNRIADAMADEDLIRTLKKRGFRVLSAFGWRVRLGFAAGAVFVLGFCIARILAPEPTPTPDPDPIPTIVNEPEEDENPYFWRPGSRNSLRDLEDMLHGRDRD